MLPWPILTSNAPVEGENEVPRSASIHVTEYVAQSESMLRHIFSEVLEKPHIRLIECFQIKLFYINWWSSLGMNSILEQILYLQWQRCEHMYKYFH